MAPPEHSSDKPLYDLTKLREMAGDDEPFVVRMATMFVDQTPETLKSIETAYTAGDLAQVRSLAHKMKPSIDFMSIDSLKSDIRLIEKHAEEGDPDQLLPDLLEKLYSVGQAVCRQIAAEVGS